MKSTRHFVCSHYYISTSVTLQVLKIDISQVKEVLKILWQVK